MAKIRQQNLRREEVDTVDEVQRAFNDVYRILREQQQEIAAAAPAPAQPAPAPEKPKHVKKETK